MWHNVINCKKYLKTRLRGRRMACCSKTYEIFRVLDFLISSNQYSYFFLRRSPSFITASFLQKLVVDESAVIYPPDPTLKRPTTHLQERLIKKLGVNAHPFYFELPTHCPLSVSVLRWPGTKYKNPPFNTNTNSICFR